ncbi:MAG: cytochrome c [uncultured bacterium]|nr:MAG: cytochrome c [uncultured bacterium]
MGERYVGPNLVGVTTRRKPEWVMNMILNPVEMTQKDPVANDLLATYLTQMTFQNVTQDEVRLIYEFFRQNDAEQPK